METKTRRNTSKKFYVTTAIDYTNDVVHIGHSYQKILADVLARFHRLTGDETFFLTGTDEHGQKVEKSAREKGVEPKKFVDEIAKRDKEEWDKLNISYDRFIRTTDKDHVKFAQEFYLKSKARGDIYLSNYEGLYCEGCEKFLDQDELINKRCPFHPNREPLRIKEENYFFKLSKYQKFLLDHIKKHPDFIVPKFRRNEVINFIKGGLKDFSVSRKSVGWGIPVPDDPNHTIYVWFDALINYLTYGIKEDCWPATVHILGKDNLRFHAIYWPAMLASASYDLPKTILVHEFISLNGQKISKSLGNVILPSELIEKYGVDPVRYFFLKHGPLDRDVDITIDKITEVYNSDLANGLGNLVARVSKLIELKKPEIGSDKTNNFSKGVAENLNNYRFASALDVIWGEIKRLDNYLDTEKPWTSDKKDNALLWETLAKGIRQIAYDLQPILPQTGEAIRKQFSGNTVKTTSPLFPRLE